MLWSALSIFYLSIDACLSTHKIVTCLLAIHPGVAFPELLRTFGFSLRWFPCARIVFWVLSYRHDTYNILLASDFWFQLFILCRLKWLCQPQFWNPKDTFRVSPQKTFEVVSLRWNIWQLCLVCDSSGVTCPNAPGNSYITTEFL